MGLGIWEISIIVLVALVFFGPSKLPSLGKSLGEALRGLKSAMNEAQNAMNETASPPRSDSPSRTQVRDAEPAPADTANEAHSEKHSNKT